MTDVLVNQDIWSQFVYKVNSHILVLSDEKQRIRTNKQNFGEFLPKDLF